MNRRSTQLCLAVTAIVAGAWVGASVAAQRHGALPDAARTAVADMFPGGRIVEIESERRVIHLYEVSVRVDGAERELLLTGDGRVLEVEHEIDPRTAPEPVKNTLKRLSRSARLAEVEKIEVHGELRVVALDQPRVEYEAEFRVRGREQEVRLSEAGKVLNQQADDDDNGDNGDDGRGNDDD
jgi:hypothetical protein